MTLIKSKINSLAWLKSAIYISVVGGIILSSKSASAISFDFSSESLESATISLKEPFVQQTRTVFTPLGKFWKASLTIEQQDTVLNDVLTVSGQLQHINAPHTGDSFGSVFTFDFEINPDGATGNEIILKKGLPLDHLGTTKHSDRFDATLTAFLSSTAGVQDIKRWELDLTAKHNSYPVPEPTTIFGSALALGVGGWLKRKKSSQHNKTAA